MIDKISSPFNKTRMMRYAHAENLCPNARDNEIAICEHLLQKIPCQKIIEIGSGTGFLTNHLLSKNLIVDTIDPSGKPIKGVRSHFAEDVSAGFPADLQDCSYDLVISLATFHHITKTSDELPVNFVNDVTRVTQSGGHLVIIDVPSSYDIIGPTDDNTFKAAKFTNELFTKVVEPYSIPSHNGIYLNTSRIQTQLESYGWKQVFREPRMCSWKFPSIDILHDYISNLFNIPNITSITEYQDLIENVIIVSSDQIELSWALSTLVMKKSS